MHCSWGPNFPATGETLDEQFSTFIFVRHGNFCYTQQKKLAGYPRLAMDSEWESKGKHVVWACPSGLALPFGWAAQNVLIVCSGKFIIQAMQACRSSFPAVRCLFCCSRTVLWSHHTHPKGLAEIWRCVDFPMSSTCSIRESRLRPQPAEDRSWTAFWSLGSWYDNCPTMGDD